MLARIYYHPAKTVEKLLRNQYTVPSLLHQDRSFRLELSNETVFRFDQAKLTSTS